MYNPFIKRLDIALPCRLVQEGYPHIRLQEQRRMHSVLAEFPGRSMYGGELRSGASMMYDLDHVKPGLSNALKDIMIKSGQQSSDLLEDHGKLDGKLRLHWREVRGKQIYSRKSKAVKAHVETFFNKIFPKLSQYFRRRGEKMSEEVMIICAYAHAKRLYQNRISHERKKNSALTNDDMPPLETVDGSQGKQSFMVILDGTFQKGDYLGFMTDPLRANVAITRAQEICWIIGGAMICSEPASEKQIIVQYKREMESAGRCHRFN